MTKGNKIRKCWRWCRRIPLNRTVLLLSILIVLLVSCTGNFVELNRPDNKLSIEELKRDNYAVGSFLIQMQGVAFPEQENIYQTMEDFVGNYLGRYTTYTKELPKNHTLFNASNNWCAWPASFAPGLVSAFNEVVRLNGRKNISYALALILRAQTFLRLTDIYGPFPISVNEKDPDAYSSQHDIYLHLISDLQEATDYILADQNLKKEQEVFAPYDQVYKGDFSKWRRFASSLKLRIAIRISSVEPEMARQLAERAVREGVIEMNEDNCAISYNKSGLWTTSVSWGDSRICADLESYMTGYKDSRLEKYVSPSEVRGDRRFIGCRAGAAIGSNVLAKRLYSTANVLETTPGVWLTAAEMAFCKAEGILKGWNMGGGTARQYYEEGVRLSFEQWGADHVAEYLADDVLTEADYVDAAGGFGGDCPHVSSITVKWEDDAPIEKKMERLITQKWIALFPNGQEAWCEIRRTGYPKIFPVPQSTNGYTLLTPNRIPYDKNEQIYNRENYNKAVELLGGKDDYATPMWWQKR
ncbi:MAG: SusD/RagB family nutrient-binding outer membrane lipoprotein [Prevotella sp.]|nr:SusD/RagB family nutrient-binding outer membrane lipoprotein [Prevotella sp.]